MSKHTEKAVGVVAGFFLENRKDPTTKQVAEAMGVSQSVARKALNDAFDLDGGWRRITPTEVPINIKDSNYGFHMGTRLVPAWAVTREHLAAQLRVRLFPGELSA